jgi:uncharacterized protein with FMN-binding domain
MNRSPVVIAATVAGLALALGFRPTAGTTTSANSAALTTGNANVSGAQTVVGSDQALAGGLGDIQVKLTAANGKIVSVGMAKMNLHGPQSAQISNSVIPQLQQQTMASNGGPIHAVSGATYTSKAYATSLQAALDQLKGGPNAAIAANNGNGSVVPGPGGGERD